MSGPNDLRWCIRCQSGHIPGRHIIEEAKPRFIRLQYWPGAFKVWYNRPLRCILNFHHVRPHPGDPSWKCCVICEGEGEG